MQHLTKAKAIVNRSTTNRKQTGPKVWESKLPVNSETWTHIARIFASPLATTRAATHICTSSKSLTAALVLPSVSQTGTQDEYAVCPARADPIFDTIHDLTNLTPRNRTNDRTGKPFEQKTGFSFYPIPPPRTQYKSGPRPPAPPPAR
eukprot:scaffold212653_cov36-Tisochrysis_lutea.AAC.1